jgi:hypothetical protein
MQQTKQDRSVLLREVIQAKAKRVSREITQAIEEIGRNRLEAAAGKEARKPVEAHDK